VPLPIAPDVIDAFSMKIPESVPFRMLAMECPKVLPCRYLDDPCSHVDTLVTGLSTFGSRLKVTIILDIDD
jgi:hypothetical protein